MTDNSQFARYIFDAKQRWEASQNSLKSLVLNILKIPQDKLVKHNFVDVDYFDNVIEIYIMDLSFNLSLEQQTTLWHNGFEKCYVHYVLLQDPKANILCFRKNKV